MGEATAPAANLGFCGGKVSDGSGVVVLFVLDSGLPATGPWTEARQHRTADFCDLFHIGYWQRCRRVAVVEHDPARDFGERGAQDGDADLFGMRGTDRD